MSGTKIKTIKELEKLVSLQKKLGNKVVFTNGCFDILHFGHVMYLEEARKKGDCLVVAVNSDASVKRLKGEKRPVVNEKDRLRVIASLGCVDYACLFKEDTPLNAIKRIKPDILVKGADWNKKNIVGAEFVKASGGRVVTIKLAKGRSTSNLIKKIIETFS